MVIASIDIVTRLGDFFSVAFEWLPRLLGAIVVLFVGYIVGRILAAIVRRVLERLGLDGLVAKSPLAKTVGRVSRSPSKLLAKVVFWIVLFGSFSPAADALGVASVKGLIAAVYAYIPNVIAALVIVIAGALLAGVVGRMVRDLLPRGPMNSIAANVAPAAVMVIATFMALDQLKIAKDIVTITYAALLGSLALGAALAFGLGGRDAAAQALAQASQPRGESDRGRPQT